jgi:hypothetical protein
VDDDEPMPNGVVPPGAFAPNQQFPGMPPVQPMAPGMQPPQPMVPGMQPTPQPMPTLTRPGMLPPPAPNMPGNPYQTIPQQGQPIVRPPGGGGGQ